MTLTNTPKPQPLTFPALTFAKLAPTSFLTAHLTQPTGPLRPSGRTPSQTRTPTCNKGSLSHANGSAVVRCGDTAAVCGVRGEILRTADVADYQAREVDAEEEEGDGNEDGDGELGSGEKWRRKRRKEDTDEMARLNLLVPNIELATGCSPAHLPGGPPSVLAQTLTQRVLTLLHTSHMIGIAPLRIWFRPPAETTSAAVGATKMAGEMDEMDARAGDREEEEMAIAEVKAFWVLYIDILFISLDGNAFDAAWLAVLAALKDTLLPKAWWDADRGMVLCSDDPAEAGRLELRDVPVPLSFGVFEGDGLEKGEMGEGRRRGEEKWVLVDLDGFEEALCREEGTVVVGGGGRVVRIEKNGGAGVGMAEMRGLVELAAKRREECMGVLGMV